MARIQAPSPQATATRERITHRTGASSLGCRCPAAASQKCSTKKATHVALLKSLLVNTWEPAVRFCTVVRAYAPIYWVVDRSALSNRALGWYVSKRTDQRLESVVDLRAEFAQWRRLDVCRVLIDE